MKRNYGIDLLRIVSMLFVVVLHIVGLGGVLGNTPALSASYYGAHFLRTATFCAVNCYALISGFVGWSRKPRLSGLATIWVKAVVYCLGMTALWAIAAPETITALHWRKAIFPVSYEQYWYLTAYVALFFLQPVLNSAIGHLPRRELLGSLAALVCFAMVPLGQYVNLYRVGGGYHYFWLCILYLLGGFLGKYRVAERFSAKVWLLGYLGAVLGAWLPRMLAFRLLPGLEAERYGTLYLQYTSPMMVLAAVCLVLGFSRLELKPRMVAAVSRLSPHAFGVYLFHVQPMFFANGVVGCFGALGTRSLPEMLLGIALGTVVLYAVGTAADWVLTKALGLVKGRRASAAPRN